MTATVTPIAIPADVLAAIYAHAVAAFPDECCGYLVGAAPGAVDAAVACRNAQADGDHPIAPERGADTGFVIAGAELLAFARSFDTARPARIIYHSHTNGRAYLSAIDRRLAATPAGPAYPVQHVVIGVADCAVSESPGPYPAIDPSPSVIPRGFPRASESPGPYPATDPSPSVIPRGFPRASESRGPYPAIDPSPSVTEVAQFAWSDAARDYVEVARWSAGDAAGGAAGGPP